jgi:hypothetical protein
VLNIGHLVLNLLGRGYRTVFSSLGYFAADPPVGQLDAKYRQVSERRLGPQECLSLAGAGQR